MAVSAKIKPQKIRTIVLFLVLITAFFLSTGSSIYLGWTSGELKTRVVTPLKQSIKQISQALTTTFEDKEVPTSTSRVESVTNINIQTITNDGKKSVKFQRQGNGQNYRVEYVYPTTKPRTQTTTPGLSSDYFKEVEERSRQSREASLKWFEEAKARNALQFEANKAKMKADSDTWVQKMQAEAEQWKKDHGF